MSKTTIKNPEIKILPTDELLTFLQIISEYGDEFPEVVELPTKSHKNEKKGNAEEDNDLIKNIHTIKKKVCKKNVEFLSLSDFYCLSKILARLRLSNKINHYTYEFLEKCTVILPENEFLPRNEVLEARCEKLKAAQANTAYMDITKNVDLNTKQKHEDSFAFQLREVNRQIIAVVQFVCSVIAGFVFGFLGIELIVGNLDFGFRLLLGIMCGLVIALAEIYFLAKKLNECEQIYTNKLKCN